MRFGRKHHDLERLRGREVQDANGATHMTPWVGDIELRKRCPRGDGNAVSGLHRRRRKGAADRTRPDNRDLGHDENRGNPRLALM